VCPRSLGSGVATAPHSAGAFFCDHDFSSGRDRLGRPQVSFAPEPPPPVTTLTCRSNKNLFVFYFNGVTSEYSRSRFVLRQPLWSLASNLAQISQYEAQRRPKFCAWFSQFFVNNPRTCPNGPVIIRRHTFSLDIQNENRSRLGHDETFATSSNVATYCSGTFSQGLNSFRERQQLVPVSN
jgi:hypothetical protein